MAKDFTLIKYEEFLHAAIKAGYRLCSYENYIANPLGKVLILRHDVDKKPGNSLKTAQLQHQLGVTGTYYFRAVPESYDENVIRQIAELGHEIGYHYEDLTIFQGNVGQAKAHFDVWLEKLKQHYPIKTICMHGSPTSKWDNRLLWETYDYKEMGLIGEPYFDLDFNRVFYITDTGRRWDGNKVSVRDKVNSKFNLSFHSTDELIAAFNKGQLPDQIMQNIHPQRWTNNNLEWIQESIMQKLKNTIKRLFFVK